MLALVNGQSKGCILIQSNIRVQNFHYFFSHDESIFTIRTYYHFWKIIWNILYFWTYCFEIISHNHYLEKVHQPLGKYFSFLFCYTNLCQFIIWQILITLVVRFFIFYFIFIFSSQRNVFGFQIRKLDWILISTPTPTNIYIYIYTHIVSWPNWWLKKKILL